MLSTYGEAHADCRIRVHGQLARVLLPGTRAGPAAEAAIAGGPRGQRDLLPFEVLLAADLRTVECVRVNAAGVVGDQGERVAAGELHLHAGVLFDGEVAEVAVRLQTRRAPGD